MVAGYVSIFWQYDILSNTDYENTANSLTTILLINGVDNGNEGWTGGPGKDKNGVIDPPPSVFFDISGVAPGATLQIQTTVTAPSAFNIGIKNGLIS
jgi:hypothetical protein